MTLVDQSIMDSKSKCLKARIAKRINQVLPFISLNYIYEEIKM